MVDEYLAWCVAPPVGAWIETLLTTMVFRGKSNILVIKDNYAQAKADLDGSCVDENGKPLALVKDIPTDVGTLSADIIETTTVTYYY